MLSPRSASDTALALARREDLSAFLRARRAQLDPEAFGFPSLPRRRIQGLTRDQVASLVGIGSSYYAWIEQGRPLNVSDDVQDRLARVFALNRAETAYLRLLCNPRDEEATLVERVPAAAQQLLDALRDVPAFALNQRWDIVASNQTAARVFDERPRRGRSRGRNLLWSFFAGMRERIVADRTAIAQHVVAAFRLVYAQHILDDSFRQLVRELRASSEEFAALWQRQTVRETLDVAFGYEHDELGRLAFETVTTRLGGVPEINLCICIPDQGTQTVLRLTR